MLIVGLSSILGGQLKRFELINCAKGELDDLVQCNKVEELVITFNWIEMKASGLSMEKLRHLIPRLNSLKQLELSRDLLQPEENQHLVNAFDQVRLVFEDCLKKNPFSHAGSIAITCEL